MMADLESELVERKECAGRAPPGKDGPIEDIRQAVCAFANDVPGHNRPGAVFVGVRDDGAPSGIPITDRLLQRLADIKTDGHTLPPLAISVEKRVLAAHDVAVVTVHPSDAPPVRARGRIWIRVGPRRAVATAQDERILNERRRRRDTLHRGGQPEPVFEVQSRWVRCVLTARPNRAAFLAQLLAVSAYVPIAGAKLGLRRGGGLCQLQFP